ncbi:MAG: hypothetical protein Q8922_15080 [Bacteroidota bacterium]|nr:hypothetical protein [Bacteroidota bacterium]MDP4233900.1 hypothetical protein [Bacteroidota bacterium]MDP4243572.1 hypothetical protein [Bacteroidota bacterium]MDP4289240.1 hypothetical protein [Bacteroidota bacterium]
MRILPSSREGRYLALIFALLSVTLLFPLNDDNGHWESMAFDLIHFGRWPYVGTWDQNFPGMIVFHLVAILLFGPSDLGFRLLDVLLQTAAALMLFRFWKNWLEDRTAWLAVFIYVFYYIRSDPFVGGERDVYASLLLIAAAFPFVRREQPTCSAKQLISSGLLAGFAVLIRPSYEIYALLLVAFTSLRSQPKRAALLLVVSVLPLALSFGVYALWPYALREYWYSTVLFNLDTYGHLARPFSGFWRSLISPKLLSIPFVFGIGLVLLKRAPPIRLTRELRLLYIASIVLTLAVVLLQRKYYLYHFAMFSILLTPIAAIGIERVLCYLPRKSQWPIFIAVYFACSLPYEELWKHMAARPSGQPLTAKILASYHAMVWPDTAENRVVEYLSAPRRSEGYVEVCSYDPRMRLHLRREPAGPYASLHAIGMRADTSNPNGFTPYQKEWRRAYIDTLVLARPRFIVICRGSIAEYLIDPYSSLLHSLPGFDSLLLASYHLDTIFGRDEIYHRKDQ